MINFQPLDQLKTGLSIFKTDQSGAGHLVLVLVMAMVLVLASMGILMTVTSSQRQASVKERTSGAYYAAEGALFETIQHLENRYPDWPPSVPYTDVYEIEGGASVDREITQEDEDRLKIVVQVGVGSARRRFVGYFTPGNDSPLDVVLVMDTSLSMSWKKEFEEQTPLEAAQDAAGEFVRAMFNINNDVEIGLVAYGDEAEVKQELTPFYPDVLYEIDQLTPAGTTNIADAVDEGLRMFDGGRGNTFKIMVVLSDGVANVASICGECELDACFSASSGFAPGGGGTCCTGAAIDKADELKSKVYVVDGEPENVLVFSIFLSNVTRSACADIPDDPDEASAELTERLGRLTMLSMSSEPDGRGLDDGGEYPFYKEAANSGELAELYEEIADLVGQPGFFEYFEEEPVEDSIE